MAAGGESQRDRFERDMRLRAAIAKLSPSSMSGLIHAYAQENDDFMAYLHAELSRRGLLPPR